MSPPNHRDPRTYLVALLKVLHARGPSRPMEIYDAVAQDAGIRACDRAELDESTGSPIFRNRIQWARQGLIDAGLLLGSDEAGWQRGVWQLSASGAEIWAGASSESRLRQMIETRMAEGATRRRAARTSSRTDDLPGNPTPDTTGSIGESARRLPKDDELETVAAMVQEANRITFATLLEHIRGMNEIAFEHLVGTVLKAALRADSVRVTRATRDGGIDGILSFDALEMRIAVFEAKRYAGGNTVSRSQVDAFATAARRLRAAHALFVTSSDFSPEAKIAARDEAIQLIDGETLVQLMATHGMGLKPKRSFVVYEQDPSWSVTNDELG